jgi:hypothetical protein
MREDFLVVSLSVLSSAIVHLYAYRRVIRLDAVSSTRCQHLSGKSERTTLVELSTSLGERQMFKLRYLLSFCAVPRVTARQTFGPVSEVALVTPFVREAAKVPLLQQQGVIV